MTRFAALAIPVVAVVALAQTPQGGRDPNRPGSSPSGPASQDPSRPGTIGAQTTPDTQTRTTTSSEAKQQETQTVKGVLMDASCASGGSGTSSRSATGKESSSEKSASPTSSAQTTHEGTGATSEKTGTADRASDESAKSGSDQGMKCAATATTTAFAVQTKDGRVVRLDDIGNTRVQETLKTKPKWTEAMNSGKPVKAKVSGLVNGDTMTVTSVK